MNLPAEFARLEALRIIAHKHLLLLSIRGQAENVERLPALFARGAVLRWMQAMQGARRAIRQSGADLRLTSEAELACAHVEAALAILLETFHRAAPRSRSPRRDVGVV